MQTFTLDFTSRTRFTLFILGGILLSAGVIGVLGYYAGLGDLATLLIIAAVIYVFYKAPRFSKQQANFSLTEEALCIQWVKGAQKDRQVAWDQVASYKLEPDRLFESFVLKLHNGETLQFALSKLNDQDRHFRNFYRAFLAKVETLQQTEGNEITIRKAKTFYETTFGIVFVFVLAAVLIGSFVYAVFFK